MARETWNGPRLRELRQRRGLTPEALALRVGRSAASITSYEIGRTVPPLPVALALAEALDVALPTLLSRPEEVG